MSKQGTKQRHGFGTMSPEAHREISRKGGVAAHKKGKGHTFTPEEAREAGKLGGQAVFEKLGPEHMARIGKKGGHARRRAA